MYVCRELTDLSYPQIGREFGDRDHTTVIHAYEKVAKLMQEKQETYDDVGPGFRQQRVTHRMIHGMPEDNLCVRHDPALSKSAGQQKLQAFGRDG